MTGVVGWWQRVRGRAAPGDEGLRSPSPAQAGTKGSRPDLEYVANRDRPRHVELTREDIFALLALLHRELARIRATRGDEPAVVEGANEQLGRLIWRLEEADSQPMTPGRHSADAVQP